MNQPTKKIIVTSLILTGSSFVWIYIEYLLGLHDQYVSYHPYVTNLILLLYVAVYYYFIKNLSNSIQAFEIKHGMFAGSIVGLVSAVCSMPLLWIYFNYIEVEFFDNMIAAALKKALQENESVLVALNDARSYFNLQSYLLQSLFFNLVIGLLLSLLFSYRIVKSQKIKK